MWCTYPKFFGFFSLLINQHPLRKLGEGRGWQTKVLIAIFFSFYACVSCGFHIKIPLGPLGRMCLIGGLRYLFPYPDIHLPCPHFLWNPSLTQLTAYHPASTSVFHRWSVFRLVHWTVYTEFTLDAFGSGRLSLPSQVLASWLNGC